MFPEKGVCLAQEVSSLIGSPQVSISGPHLTHVTKSMFNRGVEDSGSHETWKSHRLDTNMKSWACGVSKSIVKRIMNSTASQVEFSPL